MHDIKLIKKDPDKLDESQEKRNERSKSKELIAIYDSYLEKLKTIQELQEKRNKRSKEIGLISKTNQKDNIKNLKLEVKSIKEKINKLNDDIEKKFDELNNKLSVIPNVLDKKTPYGISENDNIKIKQYGKVKNFTFKVNDHVSIGENLGLIDYEVAAKLSGSRFSVLKSELATLNRALSNYMLDLHSRTNGYKEVLVPELVRSSALYGTGQLPKFNDDLFETTKGLWLIPTAEVCLTNLHREEILDETELPIRYTAYTNCFRSEAGSSGIDTKGLIREHQFGKVELVSITKPNNSMEELDRMINCIETILKQLDLPYRIMKLCSSDVGFSSSYTLDFEVWMPGQKKYREVSSCSNCKDFQSRRMMMRVKNKINNEIYYPHTLNGSGLAIGRVIVAILENFQQENGSVLIPEVLHSYMGGIKELSKSKNE